MLRKQIKRSAAKCSDAYLPYAVSYLRSEGAGVFMTSGTRPNTTEMFMAARHHSEIFWFMMGGVAAVIVLAVAMTVAVLISA